MMGKEISGLDNHISHWLRSLSNYPSQAFSAKIEAKGVTVAEWILSRDLFDHSSVKWTCCLIGSA